MSSSQDRSVPEDYMHLLTGDKAPALKLSGRAARPPQPLTRSESESKVAANDLPGSHFACR
jgi:hypothetical protein